MIAAPYIFLEDQISGQTRHYSDPIEVIQAFDEKEVDNALKRIDMALAAGHYVAGYAAYEAGRMLSAPIGHKRNDPQPLLQFGVFTGFDTQKHPHGHSYAPLPDLSPVWDETAYLDKFDRAKAYIEAGDIYQINLTFPFEGMSKERPDFAALYGWLKQKQPVHYGAICALDETHILSLSPELFFEIDEKIIRARPMKGTAPRGATPDEDAKIASGMQADEKSQAENLMIVDLLRNDLSTVGKSGTTQVTDLFTVETYPTLHQLTSSIQTTLQDDVTATQVFARLFPCGSVTGAPKKRAMEIITELEDHSRGPYCGAIGYFDPDGSAQFNVAIRTLISGPKKDGYVTRYGVGSGIVYDSVGVQEYQECLLKSKIISDQPHLIETLKWSPDDGFINLDMHVKRLKKSAKNLQYPIDLNTLYLVLDKVSASKKTTQRIRISMSKSGQFTIIAEDFTTSPLPVKLAISRIPLTAQRQIFNHKVDSRAFYDGERLRLKRAMACDEVLFFNEKGHLCEGSFTSLFIAVDGKDTLQTPALSCGLLPGILRKTMLTTGRAEEAILTIDDLSHARQICVGNSLRGLLPAILIDSHPQ